MIRLSTNFRKFACDKARTVVFYVGVNWMTMSEVEDLEKKINELLQFQEYLLGLLQINPKIVHRNYEQWLKENKI